jgi:iron complex transport system permease protein
MKVAQYKWLILICLAVGLVFVVALSVAKGSGELSVLSVLQTFVGGGTPQEQTIVFSLRLPRILTAMLAGSALAVSGAVLQGIVRNPLASPDIIGMTGGAALFAVFFITFLSGTVSYHWLPLFALCGAAFISALIYTLAWNKGVTPIRIVLIGVGLSALAGSLTMFMIVLSPIHNATQAYVWLRGSIYGSSWGDVYMLLPWLVVFFPLAWLMARVINVHEFGEEVAAGLGSAVQRHRIALLGISIALAGAAVSVVGPVSS